MFPAAPNVAEKEASQMFDIITDSACDLTPDTARQLGVEVVPFYVSLDGEHYRKAGFLPVHGGQPLGLPQDQPCLHRGL